MCSRCKLTKDESEFYKDDRSKDKLHSECKKCTGVYNLKAKEKRRKEREIKLQLELAKPTKVCSKCGIEKDKSEFHKHKIMKDGYRSECKKCRSHHNEENKEFLYEILPKGMRRCRICGLIKEMGKFRPKKRVCWECEKEYSKNYYHAHKEHASEVNKLYIMNHKERIDRLRREYMREYIKTPEGQLVGKRHYAKRRNLGWSPINKWFAGSDGHHLRYTNDINSQDNDIGLYAPRELHQSISHNGNTGKNMAEINKLLLEWYLNTTPVEERNNQAVQLYWDYCTKPEPVWNEN